MRRVALALIAVAAWLTATDAQAPRRGARRAAPLAPPPTFRQDELDLFFPDALARVGSQPTRRTSALASGGAAPAAPTTRRETRPPTGQFDAASAETLETEIKAAGAALAAAVRSPAEFRARGFQAARDELTMLAVCFNAIGRHGGGARWREQAGAAELYFLAAADACRQPTPAALQTAREADARLRDLLRGEPMELVAAEAPPADFAALMRRLERAHQDRLAPWTASEATFARQREAVAHEAEIVRLLARTVAGHEYDHAADPDYQDHARALGAAGGAARQAASSESFQAAQAAVSQLGQACDRCHAAYRG